MVLKMFSSGYPWQHVSIQSHLLDLIRTFSGELFLEKNKHLVLLLAGTGSVLKSMECEDEKSSHMFSMICKACLDGASRVTSSAYPKAPPKDPPT